MYGSVPGLCVMCVVCGVTSVATPKSAILAWPSKPRRTFLEAKSLCMIGGDCSCRYLSPAPSWMAQSTVCLSVRRGFM